MFATFCACSITQIKKDLSSDETSSVESSTTASSSDRSSSSSIGGSQYTVISKEKIDDGSNSGLEISTLYHNKTKVMYVLASKFYTNYSISFEVMVDADGNPLLYEEGME